MKLLPHHPARNLIVVLLCLLALGLGMGRAQTTPTPAPSAPAQPTPIADRLDVYFGQVTQLPIDGPIDSFTTSPDGYIKVEKSEVSPNELAITGMAGGEAMLTIKSGDRTLVYDVAVSPMPERLYINIFESKRLTFPGPIDDSSLSQPGIVRATQPDIADNVLLVEGVQDGKTTLTVTSKGQIYRYFISVFENRGADMLQIQNAFSAKGYRALTISFDKDQAIIGGSVPTQEELDDAVRIVRQYAEFVQVKAVLGQEMEQSEYSEQEAIIINNIQRIANVKGLIVKVKFPMPTTVTTSVQTKSVGDYIEPSTVTTPQGGTVRGSGFTQPANPNGEQSPNGGITQPHPQQNVTETTTTTEDTSIPEKIFLYGDLQDDLDEAKALRVARTFCPFVVNFVTVRDPIQIRTQIRFMQIDDTNTRNTGFNWGASGPEITLGFGGNVFNLIPNPLNAFKNFITSPFVNTTTGVLTGQGVGASVNAAATLHLFESVGVTKIVREADIFLTNGQPGWYSEGEVQSYVSSAVTTASIPPVTTLTASSVFLGVNMDISPLNLVAAGGTEPQGQKIFGIPSGVGAGASSGYNLLQDSDATADKIGKVAGSIQKSGAAPIIDNTVNISTQLTLPGPGGLNGTTASVFNTDGSTSSTIDLPDFFVRTTRTRVNLRDGQSVMIDGLIDKQQSRSLTDVPFLAKIPFLSTFFKNPVDNLQNEEVVVLVTPHIIRMRDADSARYPKPVLPEMQNMARENGDVPVIKPVRYDAQEIDLRPESPKDMKDAGNNVSQPQPSGLTPRASGGLQTLQPPADQTAATPAASVDNPPSATDNSSRQPSGAPLAPSSTLP
jgi:Flp pilus assembly secretin CpaC